MNLGLIQVVDKMDIYEKLNVYMHYYIHMITLKHSLRIVEDVNAKWFEPSMGIRIIGRSIPTWELIKIHSFEDFISPEKCIIKFRGVTSYCGVYNWYCKHEKILKL